MYQMLPFRRRSSMGLRPINRIKHVVDNDGAVEDTANVVVDLIRAVDAPVITQTNQVVTASKVHAIYLHVEVSHTSTAGRPNIFMAVMKNPANTITVPDPRTIGDSDTKRYIIHQEMIMMSGDAGNGLPRPLFNGVISIPKGMQRFGPGDRLQLILRTGTVDADWCQQCHYKEFR